MQESDQGAGLLAGYMTSQQVARDLGVGVRTLDRWHQLRKGPPRTRLGKRVLYARQDVADWLAASREVNPSSQHSRRRLRRT